MEFDFALYLCAETLDNGQTNARRVYVEESSITWVFNGDGDVIPGGAFPWTKSKLGTARVAAGANTWSEEIRSGATPVVSGDLFNTLLAKQRW